MRNKKFKFAVAAGCLALMVGTFGLFACSADSGEDGKSAYELAVEHGYTGTEEEWLASLVGEDGKDGKDGSDGKDGADGKSAYELAVENGYTGTESEWLASLVGATGAAGQNGTNGANGANGKDGANGEDGKSAYELAVEHGYTGTEEEWLASLVGEDGKDGKDGSDGKDGTDGKDGEKGDTGVGVASAEIKSVENNGIYEMHLILTMTDGTEIDSGIVGYQAKHTLEHQSAVDATCTTNGHIEYWYCTDCGSYFFDETCAHSTTYSYIETQKLGHNYVDGVCTRCGTEYYTEGLYFMPISENNEISYYYVCETWEYRYMYGEVVIPSTYNGKPVKSISSEAFRSASNITSIKIPDSVTSIGNNAFEGCSSLTSITIPDSVTSIGNNAFEGCSSLTSATIGSKVESIGSFAFSYCSSLTSVTIGSKVESIGSYAFSYCSSLTSITIPDSVTFIGDNAFYDCPLLTSVTIGSKVESIDSYAFSCCPSLTSITIPDSVTFIGDNAFSGCSSLTSATFKATEGWTAGDSAIASADLATAATAASYLTGNYCYVTWTRS